MADEIKTTEQTTEKTERTTEQKPVAEPVADEKITTTTTEQPGTIKTEVDEKG